MRPQRFWWMGVLCFGTVPAAFPSEPSPAAWTERRIDPTLRDGWAFRPLQSIPIPNGADGDIANPIDRFLSVAQQTAGVKPNPSVDRRTLIRRLSFTLTGLPPSAEVVATFVNDLVPDAVGRGVDRLLASPHYGVRWARHWFDIARFAESHGYEHDYDRLNAYHYRDFVVQAFNADQPYDEFVQWQIAGDKLAPDNRQAWMATGFLAAGPHSTQITKREVERQRYDELDDIVSTIGTALLGLNIGCARCHDHPYDPIPQADFYRLAAFVTRTVRSEVELDFDPDGYRKAIAAFAEQHHPFVEAITQYEADGLRQAYRQWRETAPPSALQSTWLLPARVSVFSTNEAQWTALADGSWRVTGPMKDDEEYSITLQTNGLTVTAVRLEALTDPSLVHGGPGRDDEGNFLLSGVRIFPRFGDELLSPAVPIARAVATFEQVGTGLAGTLDRRAETAWGVDPQLGRPHAAVFHLAKPLRVQSEDELTVRLEFAARPRASIGRLRVSISTVENPPIDVATLPIPERVAEVLKQSPIKLAKDDWSALTRWFAPQDAEWRRLDALGDEHAALAPQAMLRSVLVATEGRPAIRLHTQAAEEYLSSTQFLVRGDPAQPAGIATPGMLQILDRDTTLKPRTTRTALAGWLTDVEHGAGALLARVIVNRLWQHHFGTGLVATPDDFGTRGSGPSHPELLEWLASELIRHDWQLKPIHRLMVTSAAYRRTSFSTPDLMTADPDNRCFARWTSRRLEAEALRDAMLVAAGSLDDRLDGPSEREPLHSRRSVYSFIKRSAPEPWLAAFDGPDGCRVEGRRSQTTSPAQALALMNGEQTRAMATMMAEHCRTNPDDPLRQLFQSVLQRDPSRSEREQIVRLLGEAPTAEQWADMCQVLLGLDEFVFLD